MQKSKAIYMKMQKEDAYTVPLEVVVQLCNLISGDRAHVHPCVDCATVQSLLSMIWKSYLAQPKRS